MSSNSTSFCKSSSYGNLIYASQFKHRSIRKKRLCQFISNKQSNRITKSDGWFPFIHIPIACFSFSFGSDKRHLHAIFAIYFGMIEIPRFTILSSLKQDPVRMGFSFYFRLLSSCQRYLPELQNPKCFCVAQSVSIVLHFCRFVMQIASQLFRNVTIYQHWALRTGNVSISTSTDQHFMIYGIELLILTLFIGRSRSLNVRIIKVHRLNSKLFKQMRSNA